MSDVVAAAAAAAAAAAVFWTCESCESCGIETRHLSWHCIGMNAVTRNVD